MKKFLIYFFPGARGDFLANILLDGFKSVNPDTPAVLMPFKDYVKVHRLAHENEPLPLAAQTAASRATANGQSY